MSTSLYNSCTAGYIETEGLEKSSSLRHFQVLKEVDLKTKDKHFSLNLDQFGPYSIRYNDNGKKLLLGGSRGHLASMDWITKDLSFEIQVQDSIYDIAWLHDETMVAIAQKEKVFVYDNNGVELHRVKYLHETRYLEYLQHHFLLACARKSGSITYFDTSIGSLISDVKSFMGKPSGLCQNTQNGIICVGHSNGNISMWSPKQDKPIIKMLCHTSSLLSLAIDSTGNYLATSDLSRFLKIWDIRTYKPLEIIRTKRNANNLSYSQTGFISFSYNNCVEVWKDVCRKTLSNYRYLHYEIPNGNNIKCLKFCPYDDILGIGHDNGFHSLIVPGSGEPNIDGLISNPYQTKKQRKEHGVKKLLEKIQPEIISIDTDVLTKVAKPLKSELDIRQEVMIKHLMPKNPKIKAGNTTKYMKARKQVQDQILREKKRLLLINKSKESQKQEH